MIESGSLTPGIDACAFGLPAGTALRYERPVPELQPLLSSYAALDSDPAIWRGPDSWALPGWARLWVVLTDGPITVGMRSRRYAPLGAAMVFGATSRAMPVSSRGGVSVVVDISPMGWARLFDVPADAFRDKITPLDELLPAWSDALIAMLHPSDRAGGVKALLDGFFLERLPAPHRDEAQIAQFNALLNISEIEESQEAADRLGLSPRALLRLSNRYFGYGPKVLMRRTRFLRALTEMLLTSAPVDFSAVPPGYHDVPHFLRDANYFLGLTPRRFLAMPMPYLRAVLRARQLVFGAAMPLLDRPAA